MTAAVTPTGLDAEVLVIGGGPAGAATAHRIATAGIRVVVVERRTPPRPKTCGDALSPLAVAELAALGIGDADLAVFHRVDAIRLVAGGRRAELSWPAHPATGGHGYVARRSELDELVLDRATAAGAELLAGHDAVAPIVERGFLRGAVVLGPQGGTGEVRSRYTVVADGANSRFGRALGTFRKRAWPYATAIRSYWSSPLHDAPVIELVLDLADRDGTPITGYGWVFPLADGSVNIGAGVVSTSREFRSVNTTHLLASVAAQVAERWQIDPARPHDPPASGRIPLGGSVGPVAGPTYLVVGDAAGSANPLTGAGIEYAYATGRLAGEVLVDAIEHRDSTALQRYPVLVDEAYGTYFKVGRLLDRVAGRPWVMRRLAKTVVRLPGVGGAVVRIAANQLRPNHPGGAEIAFRAARTLTRFAPEA